MRIVSKPQDSPNRGVRHGCNQVGRADAVCLHCVPRAPADRWSVFCHVMTLFFSADSISTCAPHRRCRLSILSTTSDIKPSHPSPSHKSSSVDATFSVQAHPRLCVLAAVPEAQSHPRSPQFQHHETRYLTLSNLQNPFQSISPG